MGNNDCVDLTRKRSAELRESQLPSAPERGALGGRPQLEHGTLQLELGLIESQYGCPLTTNHQQLSWRNR